jgi:hypothetical protein
MKKIFLAILLLIANQIFSQDKNYTNSEKANIEVYGKCFKDLKPIEGTKEILKQKKDASFCSLYQCISRIGYAEGNKNIYEAILKRAFDITTLLYNEGTPLYLTSGMGSSGEADEENENLTDDDHLIYISITECITSDSLEKIKNIVNTQTLRLISTK